MASGSEPISPPFLKRKLDFDPSTSSSSKRRLIAIPSPIHLTRIKSTQASNNVDTVTIQDLVGDASITEIWNFNFLFNVEWFMKQLHPDVRTTARVVIVHGSWKQEDHNRQRIEADLEDWPNVTQVKAYLPDPFATHHSKMMIVFRADTTVQVIITTANMISCDWSNMTQAAWTSPMLSPHAIEAKDSSESIDPPMGSGLRFKADLLNYLKAYGSQKTGPLVKKLSSFDFTPVRAALIGSVPSRQASTKPCRPGETLWGWLGLREVLKHVPVQAVDTKGNGATVVMQTSSIATMGPTNKWIKNLQEAFSTSSAEGPTPPKFRIMFPSADEIRRSIGGYGSGSSIHTPDSSRPGQQKQLEYLKPFMCYWAGDGDGVPASDAPIREAGRRRAAPHIKTYARFSDDAMNRIDWAMMTSANLSKQAWGEVPNAGDEVKVASFELGVVVWPDLFKDGADDEVVMTPTFKTNTPDLEAVKTEHGSVAKVVGFRVPYDLPVVPYIEGEVPWCNKISHSEVDWKGESWKEYKEGE